jgi:phage tail-like protein
MNANGLKFWLLADQQHWTGYSDLQYEPAQRVLRLASQRPVPDWPAHEDIALSLLARVPGSVDPFGMRSFLSSSGTVMSSGVIPLPVPIFKPAPGDAVTDIVIGYDGLLYLAISGGITVIDLRGRSGPVDVTMPATPSKFQAWRLAAIPEGGVWALDQSGKQMGRVTGQPLFILDHPAYSPSTVRPCNENPDPPRLLTEAAGLWPDSETPVAIATSPEGQLALLNWAGDSPARIRIFSPSCSPDRVITLAGSLRPYSVTWISSGQVAVMLPGLSEALVYPVDEPLDKNDLTGHLTKPAGDLYPLKNHDGGPFLHGLHLPPVYPAGSGPMPLVRLSLPSFARSGVVDGNLMIDSGNASTVWHRLYLEAMIPAPCGVIVHLGAVNDQHATPSQWFPHAFGRCGPIDSQTPCAAWVPASSEIPFHPGLLECPREPGRSGLFTVLIQRAGLRTRSLRGRYLKVHLEFLGNGLATPEVAALRVYASRFSYVERYLPELYRESIFPPDADQAGDCTPADFLERFIDNFEGILTPLEDKIVDSYLVTRAETTPESALDWLGSWIGVTFDSAFSVTQRRELLHSAPELFRRRGTLAGLTLALDIATDGAVTRGQIVVFEDYRLRRTFATIIGANLADTDDPLLAGLSVSGNSFVGETLFLGNPHRSEFLALFSADLPKTPQEAAAVDAFFDKFANRVTVLVHQEIEPQDLGLVRRVVNLETPAHVLARVERATQPFLAGVASIVGVDTYLAPKTPRQPARVDISFLSRDYVLGVPSLDPRMSGAVLASEPPVASIAAPALQQPGQTFNLDGSASAAAEGRKIATYIWTLME